MAGMVMIVIFMIMVVVVMIIVVVMICMTSMIIMIVMNMNLAIKVLSFSPDQSGTDSGLNGERPTIAEAPLKNTTKQAINGVVLGITLKVGIKTTMAFDAEDRSEVELTSFQRFFTTPMGTMGLGRQSGCKGTQQQSQEQKARAEHETQQKSSERQEWKRRQRIDDQREFKALAPD